MHDNEMGMSTHKAGRDWVAFSATYDQAGVIRHARCTEVLHKSWYITGQEGEASRSEGLVVC